MTYIAANDSSDGVATVIYQSKDGTSAKTFDALDWLAQLVTRIPNKGEQMVRYYGYYSNKSRGLRKKAGTDDQVPALIDSDISPQAFRKNWARLIDASICGATAEADTQSCIFGSSAWKKQYLIFLKPLLFDMSSVKNWSIGEQVAGCLNIGKEFKKKQKSLPK